MFKTQKQIDEVSIRTGVPPKLVRELGIMMSHAKLAQEDIKSIEIKSIKSKDFISKNSLDSAKGNINKAVSYFENKFLKCKLW